MNSRTSEAPTPWAVTCPTHGQVFLSREEYSRQLVAIDNPWTCPECEARADWDDENYALHIAERAVHVSEKGDESK